jgi:hypothetical protein
LLINLYNFFLSDNKESSSPGDRAANAASVGAKIVSGRSILKKNSLIFSGNQFNSELILTKDVDRWYSTEDVKNLFDRCQTVSIENFHLIVFRHQIFGIEDFIDHVDVPVACFKFSQNERSVDGHSLMMSESYIKLNSQCVVLLLSFFLIILMR